MKYLIIYVSLALATLARSSVAASYHETERPSTAQVVQMQIRLFEALSREDHAAWVMAAAPDFVAHERGKTYDAAASSIWWSACTRPGVRPRWSVTSPNVTADNCLAVMSYVDDGSITRNQEAPEPIRWLETVAFRKTASAWQAFLVTSMRVQD